MRRLKNPKGLLLGVCQDKYTDKNLPTIDRLEESRELNHNVWLRYTEEGEVREDWFLRSLKKHWYKKFI